MQSIRLRAVAYDAIPGLYARITRDFPTPAERPPLATFRRYVKSGAAEAFDVLLGAESAAYTACTWGDESVLCSFLAVEPAMRGRGIGSLVLRRLCAYYESAKGIIVEVEQPELAEEEADRLHRERRIAFYERAGFTLVPGLDYAIWGMPMHLMVRPLCAGFADIAAGLPGEMTAVYGKLFPPKLMHKMRIERK